MSILIKNDFPRNRVANAVLCKDLFEELKRTREALEYMYYHHHDKEHKKCLCQRHPCKCAYEKAHAVIYSPSLLD